MFPTRHEKAILVILAYIIGFLTAYILYSFCTSSNIQSNISVTKEELEISKPEIVRTTNNDIYNYSNGKLNIFKNGELKVLTAAYNPLSSYMPENNESYSVHYNTPVISLSPNDNFLYFCIQETPEADYCAGYVYNFDMDTVNRILVGQEPATLTLELANELEWNQQGLVLEHLHSIDSNTPWLLIE